MTPEEDLDTASEENSLAAGAAQGSIPKGERLLVRTQVCPVAVFCKGERPRVKPGKRLLVRIEQQNPVDQNTCIGIIGVVQQMDHSAIFHPVEPPCRFVLDVVFATQKTAGNQVSLIPADLKRHFNRFAVAARQNSGIFALHPVVVKFWVPRPLFTALPYGSAYGK